MANHSVSQTRMKSQHKYVKLIKKLILHADSIITVSLSFYKHLSIHQEQSIQLTFIILSNSMARGRQLNRCNVCHFLVISLDQLILKQALISPVWWGTRLIMLHRNKLYQNLNNMEIYKDHKSTHIRIQPPKIKAKSPISWPHQVTDELTYFRAHTFLRPKNQTNSLNNSFQTWMKSKATPQSWTTSSKVSITAKPKQDSSNSMFNTSSMLKNASLIH